MRLAVFGLGSQAKAHIEALRDVPGAQLACVLVRDLANSAAAAAKLGLTAETDLSVLLADRSIDGVVIATPTSTHADLACAAFAAGKHVFCETPLAHTVSEADRVIAAARVAGKALQVGFIHRFENLLPRLFEEVRSGAYGAVVGIETERLSAFAADGQAKPHHGDAIEELLAFDLHNLIWGVGQPREVAALGRANDQGRYADVTALVNMGEVTARCFASAGMPKGHPFVERMRVRCERAVLCADLRFSSRRQETFLGVEGGKVFAAVQNDPMHEQLVHFVSVMRGARCLADGAVARAVLQLVEATRSAADGGERVGVDQEIGV